MTSKDKQLDAYPNLLGVPELSELTGQCPATIRSLCARQKLPAVKIGRRWYVARSSFVDYLNGGTNAA